MKQCRHCNKDLPSNRPSFCDVGCSHDFFMAKQRAKQFAEIPRVTMICGRTDCSNEFVKVGKRGRSYCCTKCQQQHNAHLAKVKRDEKLNNRPVVHRVCNACGTDFIYDRTKPRQGYCSSRCQIKNKEVVKSEKYVKVSKEMKREYKKPIDKKWLSRGNVSLNNYDCAISGQA